MSSSTETILDLESIRARLREFADARDWHQFHSPKNLVMALVGEIGELVEEFQWLTEDESRNLSAQSLVDVGEELADVQIFLIMLADKLGVDLLAAVDEKITKNEAKYPPEKARGTHKKYTKL